MQPSRDPLLSDAAIFIESERNSIVSDERKPIASMAPNDIMEMYKENFFDKLKKEANDYGEEVDELPVEDLISILTNFFSDAPPIGTKVFQLCIQRRAVFDVVYQLYPTQTEMYTGWAYREVNRLYMEQLHSVVPVEHAGQFDQPIDDLYSICMKSGNSPRRLMYKVTFEMLVYFSSWAVDSKIKPTDWSKDTFCVFIDRAAGLKYISLRHPTPASIPPRLYQCDGDTCPVRSFIKLRSKLPTGNTPLFCREAIFRSSDTWYSDIALETQDYQQLFAQKIKDISLQQVRQFSDLLRLMKLECCPPFRGYDTMPDRLKGLFKTCYKPLRQESPLARSG